MLSQTTPKTAVVYHLLQQGVDGFLSKNVNEDVLVEAIQTVLKGEIYYSEEYSEKIKYFISTGNIPKFKLSKNEIEIIKLLSSGKSSKEIAHMLNYSVRSVETKRYRLERKMFAKNSTELVSIAIKCGLIKV